MSFPKQTRFDLPAVFGPSLMPDVTDVPEFHAAVVSFETGKDAAAALLPSHFEIADRAVVSLARMTYRDVDYLGGRSYHELVWSINAVYNGPDQRIEAPYMPVLWVSDVYAILAGREFMGYAKIYGELPEVQLGEGTCSFECLEYGTRLLRGELSGLKAMSSDALLRVHKSMEHAPALGWKYIPGPEGTVDADYPTKILNHWDYKQAFSGEGRLNFATPTFKEAPFSSRIMAALAALPIKEYRRAFVGTGSCRIDRVGTRRLAKNSA